VGRLKIAGYKILLLALIIFLIYTAFAGLSFFIFGGFMDFPCSIEYVEQDDCILSYGSEQDNGEDASRIEVFLTSYAAGFRGGGCLMKKSETNTLDVRNSIIDLGFEREGSRLKVNDEVLEDGAEFHLTNFFNWNPWIISRIRFKNLGLVTECQTGSDRRSVVIIGSYGTEVSLGKGLSVSSVLIAGLIFTYLRLKRLKTDTTLKEKLLETNEAPN